MEMKTSYKAAIALALTAVIAPAHAAFQSYVGKDVTYKIDWSQSWLTGLSATLTGNTLMFTKADGSSIASTSAAGNGNFYKDEKPVDLYSWFTVEANSGKQISDIHAEQLADIKLNAGPSKLPAGTNTPALFTSVSTTVGVLTPGNGSGWQWVGYSTYNDRQSMQYVPGYPFNNVYRQYSNMSFGDSLIENGAVIPKSPWLNLSFDSYFGIYGQNFANVPNTFAKLSLNGIGVTVDTVTAPVPEPETYALMGVGLLGLLAARRRKA
ncbi:PEP-CTERM sorting domain-containing protein [uncultured Chitinibacter sp.]|uniref:PEP-CTERM sorting domain-containing protein n=2 Tax=Chitinibacter TaxID=230666 RepID=UPI0025945391|nr:PEP-CTERM sorting domain-containing protein [uncultured Chitinibacter sp.]